MNAIIKVISEKAGKLQSAGDELVKCVKTSRTPGWNLLIQLYHNWYAGCLGLVEVNMPSRLPELASLHRNMTMWLSLSSSGLVQERDLLDGIAHMQGIVFSVPEYLESRLHNLELAIEQAFGKDLLAEAQVLLDAGHVRAAGAVAGVMLEKHLKLLCDRRTPPILYDATATLSPLNQLLKKHSVYDTPQWQRVQTMGSIRNKCDHANPTDPTIQEVDLLITEVKNFTTTVLI